MGLTIGDLARAVGMSKSGLFAHFQSKEQLQIDVLREASERFIDDVVRPAIKLARGEPRVVALFQRWLQWVKDLPGGCPFVAAAGELDDREGAVRDFLVRSQQDWISTLTRAAKIAVDEQHFGDRISPRQFAFELHSLMLGYHFHHRLLRDNSAASAVEQAFARLLDEARQ
jgi:AcrR family transcriptional regulator